MSSHIHDAYFPAPGVPQQQGRVLGLTVYEARTWLGGCHTRVRCGVRRPTRLPMRRCCIWVFFFHGFAPTQINSCRTRLIWPKSGRISWRPKQVEIGLKPSLFLTPKTLHKQKPSLFAHHNHQNQNQLSITTLPLKTRNGLVPKPKASLSSVPVQSNPSSPISTKKSDSPIIVIDNYYNFTYNLCQVRPQFFCFCLFVCFFFFFPVWLSFDNVWYKCFIFEWRVCS